MAYKISGKVLWIGESQTFPSKNGNSYTKRDLVITVRKFDPYTGVPTDDEGNTPKFTFFGEKCTDLNTIRIGDIVTIGFEISGRNFDKEGNREYFTDVRPINIYTNDKRECHVSNQASPSSSISSTPLYQQLNTGGISTSPDQFEERPF